MSRLSAAEKVELLALSQSDKIKSDMSKSRCREVITSPYTSETLSDFIQFATAINKIANHPRKVFKPMTGHYFLL